MLTDTDAVKTTPLDQLIESKIQPLREARNLSRAAEREVDRLRREGQALEREMQELVIARSVLRDGKPYHAGEANTEIHEMLAKAPSYG